MAYEIINIKNLAESDISLTDWLIKADTSGLTRKVSIQSLLNQVNVIGDVSFKGSLLITDTPTEGWYFAGESGTFTNAGSLVIDLTSNISIIIVPSDAANSEKIDIPIVLSGALTDADKATEISSGNTGLAISGDVYDAIEEAVSGISITTDVTDDVSLIDGWFLKGDGEIDDNSGFEIYDYMKFPKYGNIYIDTIAVSGGYNLVEFVTKDKVFVEAIAAPATTTTYEKLHIEPSDRSNIEYVRFSHKKVNALSVFYDDKAYVSDTFDVNENNTLFDGLYKEKIEWVEGYILDLEGGSDTTNGSWMVSPFIGVSESFKLSGNFSAGASVAHIAYYDSKFKLISIDAGATAKIYAYEEIAKVTDVAHIKLCTKIIEKDTVNLYLQLNSALQKANKIVFESDLEVDQLLLPKYIDVVEGSQCNLFLNNLTVDSPKLNNTNLWLKDYSPMVRKSKHLQLTPSVSQVDFDLTIAKVDSDMTVLSEKTSIVRTSPASGGLGQTVNVMVMGHSLVDEGTITTELARLFALDGDYNINLIGTRGDVGALHEGRGSWKWSNYVSGSDFAGKSNAFWHNGGLDFQEYCSVNSFSGIDYVISFMGTNDVSQGYSVKTDDELEDIMVDAKIFLDALISDYPSCKIAQVVPNFGSPIFTGGNASVFRNSLSRLGLKYIEEFDNGVYSSNLTTLSAGLWIDAEESYSYDTENISDRVAVSSRAYDNSVHPEELGYFQWADAFYAKIRSWLNGNL